MNAIRDGGIPYPRAYCMPYEKLYAEQTVDRPHQTDVAEGVKNPDVMKRDVTRFVSQPFGDWTKNRT
jgi:hypothetical protein